MGLSACVIAVSCYLFIPFHNNPPSVKEYQEDSYFSIIEKLNITLHDEPDYNNNFEVLYEEVFSNGFDGFKNSASDMMAGGTIPEVEVEVEREQLYSYEETTDNQVSGVIEGDRIKRSSHYIYYMNDTTLSIYTIEGESSKCLSSFSIENKDGFKLNAYAEEWEMFLSEDCSTITIVSSCYHTEHHQKYICLISLDVSDPANVKETQRTYLSGSYLSARLVDGEILLISNYSLGNNVDFSDKSTFVPQYGTTENMECVPADQIIAPDELSNTRYTVICKINEKTLEAISTAAFLSYSNEVYVSQDKIYATRCYSHAGEKDGYNYHSSMTEISAMTYSGESLEYAGSVTVEGSINNQYNLDEYEGILRVVTTTDSYAYREYTDGGTVSNEVLWDGTTGTNASLYCIDLSTWQLAASVEHFAPEGESVRSVRFDKDKAYVCTAIVLTDPVFVFDLSDINNITYKDTGTITGYSISLINFGEDYLLGVGYGDSFDTLKLEIYEEAANGVESVCSYEIPNCSFATEYKSYFIDREKHLIGIGYDDYGNANGIEHYSLFLFDGYDFVKIIDENITGENNYKRAVLIDGYFYMFGNEFKVRKF